MSLKDQFLAAARSESVSPKPVLAWPGLDEGNVRVVPMNEPVLPDGNGRMVLAEALNPFGLAFGAGVDLNEALDADPEAGNALLDRYVGDARTQMNARLAEGADGVLFRLHGAEPKHCTPMQYGGFYLERDRELLEEIAGKGTHVLYVVGSEEVYLDFVSDLPANVFAWDSQATAFTSEYVRSIRPGAQASADPESEIELRSGVPRVAEFLEA